MKYQKEVCVCDICKKEVSNLYKARIPIPYYILSDYFPVHSKSASYGMHDIDCCDSCITKIMNILEPHFEKFGEFAYAGVEVSWKGESDGK